MQIFWSVRGKHFVVVVAYDCSAFCTTFGFTSSATLERTARQGVSGYVVGQGFKNLLQPGGSRSRKFSSWSSAISGSDSSSEKSEMPFSPTFIFFRKIGFLGQSSRNMSYKAPITLLIRQLLGRNSLYESSLIGNERKVSQGTFLYRKTSCKIKV